jgi:predicted extracellular nuclease
VIAVAIIYNSKRVQPVNKAAVLDLGEKNRSTIAQSFKPVHGGQIFTVFQIILNLKVVRALT